MTCQNLQQFAEVVHWGPDLTLSNSVKVGRLNRNRKKYSVTSLAGIFSIWRWDFPRKPPERLILGHTTWWSWWRRHRRRGVFRNVKIRGGRFGCTFSKVFSIFQFFNFFIFKGVQIISIQFFFTFNISRQTKHFSLPKGAQTPGSLSTPLHSRVSWSTAFHTRTAFCWQSVNGILFVIQGYD